MSVEEAALTALYARRQEITKELSDVDAHIRLMEANLYEKESTAAKSIIDAAHSGNSDVDRAQLLIANCLQDVNGLRNALKVTEACRQVVDSPPGQANTKQHIHFRNALVHMVISHADELARDHNGSELLQQVLPLLRSGATAATLNDLDYDPTDTSSTLSEVMLLLNELSGALVDVLCHSSGTRVALKLVDTLSSPLELQTFTAIIAPQVVTIAQDINGNHVLARLIAAPAFRTTEQAQEGKKEENIVTEAQRNVYDGIAASCIGICKNRQGCCIIQRCLQLAPEPYYSSILKTVLNNALKLVQDPFGNYVVQFILERQRQLAQKSGTDPLNFTNMIIRQMLHHVAELSCNKFSSNVIEKCLKTATPDVRQLLVDELTEPHVLPKLLTDSFANYVIQTAISTASDGEQFTQIRESIMPLQNLLKNSPYGVRIEAKLSRRYRATTRPTKQKPATHVHAAPPPPPPPPCQAENIVALPFALQSLLPDGGIQSQPMAFANVHQDMSPLFQQQGMMNSVPFMLQGAQHVIGLSNVTPQSHLSMNMLGDRQVHREY